MVTEKYRVYFSDVDKNYKLTNVALLRAFQNVVTTHANSVGDVVVGNTHAWFLTAYKVRIFRRPEMESEYYLSTWSRGVNGFIASREFEARDEKGNLLLCAVSNWVRVNKSTGKMERATSELVDAYGKEEKTNFDFVWIPKLKECERVDFERTLKIERNFIDGNNHVNNVAYLDLASIALPQGVFDAFDCKEFDIMYKIGIKCGDEVSLLFTEEENYYNVTVKSEDKSVLHAIVRFYK